MSPSAAEHPHFSKASPLPRVTVGVPVYNDAAFIEQALRDLDAQTFRDFEVIISDNASTDGTSEICRAFAERHPYVRYYCQDRNVGARENIKFVLRKARGQYFSWAASDDRRDPDFLKILVAELDADPTCPTSFCRFVSIDSDNQVLQEFDFDFSGGSPLIRLTKFMLCLNRRKDVLFYGLHRTNILKKARFYRWWGVNKEKILRTAYPIVAYLLAHGYRHVDRVLFKSRMDPVRPRAHYRRSERNSLCELAALNLLEINVHYAIIVSVCQALRSIVILPFLLPLSILSFFVTMVREDLFRIFRALLKLWRRQLGA